MDANATILMPRLIVKCPNCKREQVYIPRGGFSGKSKACVACGTSFIIYNSHQSHNVVKFDSPGNYK